LTPSYEQRAFDATEREGRWQLVASRDGRDGSLKVHQDAAVYLGGLAYGATLEMPLRLGRHAWLQVVRGAVEVNGEVLNTSDGAAVSGEPALRVKGVGPAEVMLFDLA
jgi:redox-sensitive bicupin YhaK (pirin superfamily)